MNTEFKTLELAKLFESQGHYQDALEIYESLAQTDDDPDISDACKRLRGLTGSSEKQFGEGSSQHMAGLLETWLRLLILKKRLGLYRKITSRL